jgi:hypothetical protein
MDFPAHDVLLDYPFLAVIVSTDEGDFKCGRSSLRIAGEFPRENPKPETRLKSEVRNPKPDPPSRERRSGAPSPKRYGA